MDPSGENKRNSSSSRSSSNFLPAIILFLVFVTIGGILFYFKSESKFPFQDLPVAITEPQSDSSSSEKTATVPSTDKADKSTTHSLSVAEPKQDAAPETNEELSDIATEQNENNTEIPATPIPVTPEQDTAPPASQDVSVQNIFSQCVTTTERIDRFYQHLDQQQYMKNYGLTTSSKIHFTNLIQKLLNNPPQVARETDDLYTILKNTAHFFRISGKDNILMLKGILDSERGSLEKVLADYYFLISCPDCSDTPYVLNVDPNALYEYACFFLNTMGGRLYLFRRDALSRMVVTYYAILLVDQANERNNNRYGIDLKPAIDMLIAEIEGGGSALKKQKSYLDTLYTLKEQYQ